MLKELFGFSDLERATQELTAAHGTNAYDTPLTAPSTAVHRKINGMPLRTPSMK
jgi:hypothetical protein